jgi:predicted transcriptional regulator of viral defense system
MTVSTAVAQSIDQYAPGQVFGYRDLPLYQSKPSNVVQIVNRLVKKNEIKRLSKGKFYKPKQSVIGDLRPSDSELLKTVLFKNGAIRGYITGTALFNQLGLTTQVPRTISVATKGSRQKKDFGTIRISLVPARAPFRSTDIPLLQYLDVLRNIKKIPDAEINESLGIMERKFSDLDDKQIKRVQYLALEYYGAQARALTGLLVSRLNRGLEKRLKESLSPLTLFKLRLDNDIWPEKRAWNIQ